MVPTFGWSHVQGSSGAGVGVGEGRPFIPGFTAEDEDEGVGNRAVVRVRDHAFDGGDAGSRLSRDRYAARGNEHQREQYRAAADLNRHTILLIFKRTQASAVHACSRHRVFCCS